jgi:hypothetical protein
MAISERLVLCTQIHIFFFTDFTHEYHALERGFHRLPTASTTRWRCVPPCDASTDGLIVFLGSMPPQKPHKTDILDSSKNSQNRSHLLGRQCSAALEPAGRHCRHLAHFRQSAVLDGRRRNALRRNLRNLALSKIAHVPVSLFSEPIAGMFHACVTRLAIPADRHHKCANARPPSEHDRGQAQEFVMWAGVSI